DLQQSGIILNKQAKQNTPARIRMSILYAVAATVDGRVVNTSNLSESWIGYSTKFGDGAGDFSPLANLTATETAEIGRVMGLPLKFTDKTPEDGLSGLTDEENFGFTYAILDNYIRSGVCEDPAAKEKIDTLRKHNNHKTQPIPAFRF
ncbi:MAG: NAD(+) synthase, partial [Oscillospiraceae bacterium]|nr:NAD(+) synthase [Oscillospiraceae bacterium]